MKTLLTTFTLLSIINFFHGQTKSYFMNKLGKTIDKETYDFQKQNSLEKIQKNIKSMKIVEDLNELYNRNDSLVYSYTWHFTDSPKKTIEELEKKKAIIGKEYPIENETTLGGKNISLSNLKGKPTLVNLWFTFVHLVSKKRQF